VGCEKLETQLAMSKKPEGLVKAHSMFLNLKKGFGGKQKSS